MNIVNIEYLKNFLPQENLYKFTFATVLITVFLSIFLWKLLNKNMIINILLGQNKVKNESIYEYIYSFSKNNILFILLSDFYKNIIYYLNIQSIKKLINNKKILIFVIMELFFIFFPKYYLYFNMDDNMNNIKIEGDYYKEDSFVGKNISFSIKSKKEGILIVKGYIPIKLNGTEEIAIEIDGENKNVEIIDNNFELSIDIKKYSTYNIILKPNWIFKAEQPDVRELSFMLTDIYFK